MGACLSCLGLGSNESSPSDPSERAHLLDSGSSRPQYGASNGPTSYRDLAGSKQDPELDRREREALNAIWKSTSDKLIDISSTTTLSAEHAAAGAPDIDFQRLFRDTFPRRPPRPASSPQPGTYNNADSASASELLLAPEQTSSAQKPADEQTWLRDIIMRNPADKSWDCNTVHKIGKPLIIEFDDVPARDEGDAVRSLKAAKHKLK